MFGKYLRLYRILNPSTHRTVIIALDHGSYGVTEGLEDIAKVIKHVISGGADAVVLQPGALKSVYR